MAEIALMVCAVSSLAASVGGGFYFMQKQKDEERMKNIKDMAYNQLKFIGFSECNFKGTELNKRLDIDNNEDTPNLIIKSFAIPEGYSFRTFPQSDKKGNSFTYKGPAFVRCADKTIKSFIIYKGSSYNPGDSMGSP
jgi:hypothetical protein